LAPVDAQKRIRCAAVQVYCAWTLQSLQIQAGFLAAMVERSYFRRPGLAAQPGDAADSEQRKPEAAGRAACVQPILLDVELLALGPI